MTPDERKQYNKEYYSRTRVKLLDTLNKKVQCNNCGRTLSYSSLKLHQKSKLCKKHGELIYVQN